MLTTLTLHVRQGNAGLWYAMSPEEPGLLVAERTRDAAVAAVPVVLNALAEARADQGVE